ncbi:hypothetical protein [Herpetosiphon geysericola]|uniref:Uncharacterized protein n=1 Tax=Herpetosiphon geysericola TaxID=70996 RepID=A0A0P6XRR4_9CHLR|nr:hypothetical protein [Herpetosiphon geysericola]KPL85317.1 hypothetical protein SE18_16760 [Herpetosiphon geysericola]
MAKLLCPACKKALKLSPVMRVGAQVGCVNCDNVLKVVSRNPDKIEVVAESATHNADSKPESYA